MPVKVHVSEFENLCRTRDCSRAVVRRDGDYVIVRINLIRRAPGLGDLVASGLAAVGITKERVQAVASKVGVKDCGCKKRQQRLNDIGRRFGIG